MKIERKVEEKEFLSAMKVLGDNIKARHETLGQAHDQVAKAIKISVARLKRIEEGTEERIHVSLIAKFAWYFKIAPGQLWVNLSLDAKKISSKSKG
jgi:hypothetical protein